MTLRPLPIFGVLSSGLKQRAENLESWSLLSSEDLKEVRASQALI